jgi:hypothetical protein
VTDQTRDHARYDELAAGYAVHALDPGDDAEFRAHLPGCPRCQAAVGDFTEVTAALGDNWLTAEPSPQLGERIMAAVTEDLAADSGRGAAAGGVSGQPGEDQGGRPATVTDLAQARRRRRLRTIASAAAAAAVLAAGGAVWGGLSGTGSTPAGPTAGCVHAGSCREVTLTDASSRTLAAKVIVTGGTAWLIPSGLPRDDTATQVYVLWQITGAHTPLAVGSFDVTGHGDKPMLIGKLAVPYRGTWAFAVSIEHGRTIPATPSHPVALGQVLS